MTSEFLTRTRTQYGNLKARYKRKKLPPIPFTLEQYREHVAAALGVKMQVAQVVLGHSGALRCRYCGGWFGIASIVGDHAVPLSRQGALGLENIEFICAGCNHRKGELTGEEYDSLLAYLDTVHPQARTNILRRLQAAVKLEAADAWRRRREWIKK